ncbi:hypothetical protein FEM48_Zijuj03G0072800 [Ziziphus jujuba var. spinosa]|uniref:SOSEKI DIX-like domain-containing protein n=1 Tax=Ziziphus jujuba var. spinosa TaxID=714518 RepID=A0A978VNX3_ZIZJJ|nr:hypothetical protein FEM48_Zijuj03G0072800 [Ziziphus jujuba var. spinosa]
MVVNLGGKAETSMPKKWQDRDNANPKRTNTLMETKPKTKSDQKVPVIYYLSRNGQLEHPHFMEVLLSSPQGLYLKDVINRLSSLRGPGICSIYSWASKRRYRNRFVWQDLSENDFIYPCQGNEYILKGSKLLETSQSFRSSYETPSSSSSISSAPAFFLETNSSCEDFSGAPTTIIRRKNQSWSLIDDLREYQVYKAKTTGELAGKSTNASTQTEEKATTNHGEVKEFEGDGVVGLTEQSKEEASVLSNYCFGGLGSMEGYVEMQDGTVENSCGGERRKASTVLMQLIRCGSRGVKDCESAKSKD